MFRNSQLRYGTVAIMLHWLIALLVIVMVAVGFLLEELESDLAYQLHKSTGLVILSLTMVRIVWRLLNPVPNLPARLSKPWERLLFRGAHIGFYILLIAMPLSGWLLASTGKYPTIFYGLFEFPRLPLPADSGIVHEIRESAGWAHFLLAWGMIGLFALHVGAAIHHQLILKDDTLQRMLPVRSKQS